MSNDMKDNLDSVKVENEQTKATENEEVGQKRVRVRTQICRKVQTSLVQF